MSQDKRQLECGMYEGEVENYGIMKNSKGEPNAFIKFKINKGEGQGFAELTWFGGLSDKVGEKAKKSPAAYTISTLLDCGFKGKEVEDLALGTSGDTIDLGRVMAITIEDNLYNDVVSSRIKWINPVGSTGKMETMGKDEVTTKINSSALRAMLLKEKEAKPTIPEGLDF